MSNFIHIFEKQTQKYFIRGNRNNNFPVICRWAMKCELDFSECEAYVRGEFGSDWTKSDEASLKKAWEKVSKEDIVTISQYKKEKEGFDFIKFAKESKELDRKLEDELRNYDKHKAFDEYLEKLKKKYDAEEWLEKHKPEQPKDSSFLLKIFSEDDWVWINNDVTCANLSIETRDIKSFAEKKRSLRGFNFFIPNPLKDPTGRSDVDIKSYRYLLLEADNIADKNDQVRLMLDLINHNVPIKMGTFTGNKSIHMLVKVSGINNKYEWDAYVDEIFENLNKLKEDDLFDNKCKNPSRLSRLPGAWRDDAKMKDPAMQELYYLQEDEAKLQGDARDTICAWVKKIIGDDKEEKDEKTPKDEIAEDELLSLLKSRDKVYDIWDDGSDIHTLKKEAAFDLDGKIVYEEVDKTWRNPKSFYNFMQQLLEEQYGAEVDLKALKLMKIRYKTAQKHPFVGERNAVKKDIVNTFVPGWLYKALKDDKIPATLNEPLKKLLHNLFGDQKEEMKWTLQWMREFMHTFKVMTVPVFWEKQGTGKSMLATAFAEAIGDWMDAPLKKEDVQFNAWQDHTVIIFEESSSGSKRDGKDFGDMLKNMITSMFATIEAKGKDPVKKMVKNCFIFNANISEQIGPVYIEDTDRRYTIIRNDDALNLIDIWTDEDYERWNSGEYQKQLMKWIYYLPKDKSIDIRRGLDNKWKQDVISMSKNNLEYCVEDFIAIHQGFYSSTDLMVAMKDEYGVQCTSRGIGNVMKKLGYESKVKIDFNKAKRGYELDGKPLEAAKNAEEKQIIEVETIDDILK